MNEFRILEKTGTQKRLFWQGRAFDADSAIERAYSSGGPGKRVVCIVEMWGVVNVTKTLQVPGWVRVWIGRVSPVTVERGETV